MIDSLKESEQHQHSNGGGWVADTAIVDKTAYVGPNAQVYGNAWVSGDARVYGYARVSGGARVSGYAWVYGNAQVSGNARVSGGAQVYGNAQMYGNAWVSGDAQVFDGLWVTPPLYIQGTKHSITNCDYGKIAIGCEIHTFAEWKKNYKTIGKNAGYTAEQIKEYGRHIAYVVKMGR
jgi:hypothetical protein